MNGGRRLSAPPATLLITLCLWVCCDGRGVSCADEHVIGSPGFLVQSRSIPVSVGAAGVQLTDLNGDGHLDAMVVKLPEAEVCILDGNGDLTFRAARCLPLSGIEPAVAVTDDDLAIPGRPDLITAGRTLSVLPALGGGRFGTACGYPLVGAASALLTADVNLDRRNDVLVSDQSANLVSVRFAKPVDTLSGPLPCAALLSDPLHYQVGDQPVGLLFLDLDGNGRGEIVTVNRGTPASGVPPSVTVLGQSGTGRFTGCAPSREQPQLRRPSALLAVDIDGDGLLDLLVADEDAAALRVLTNLGGLRFDCGEGRNATIQVAEDPLALAAADFDRDGREDVIVVHGNGNQVSLLLAGPDSLLPPLLYPVGKHPNAAAIGDLDEDGRPDLVVSNGDDAEFSISVLANGFR